MTAETIPRNNRISVKEAAARMGVCEQFIRIGLQRSILPFGYAVKLSSKWTYYISEDKLTEHISSSATKS